MPDESAQTANTSLPIRILHISTYLPLHQICTGSKSAGLCVSLILPQSVVHCNTKNLSLSTEVVVVPVGLEPTVSLRSVRFAIGTGRAFACLLVAHHASASLWPSAKCPQDTRSAPRPIDVNDVTKNLSLSTEVCGGASRTRTYDPIDVNDVLYQLSHGTMSLDDM